MKMQALESHLGSFQPSDGSPGSLVVDLAHGVSEPLGNWRLQEEPRTKFAADPSPLWNAFVSAWWTVSAELGATPAIKLQSLKRQRLSAETREERVAKAVAVLNAASALQLTSEQWRDAAENPEFEEED